MLRSWDLNCPLDDDQREAISVAENVVTELPFPERYDLCSTLDDEESDGVQSAAQHPYPSSDVSDISTLEKFHCWFEATEKLAGAAKEEIPLAYGKSLREYVDGCDWLLHQTTESLKLLDHMISLHGNLTKKTKSLDRACAKLLSERENLERIAGELRQRLSYFDELERVGSRFNDPMFSVTSDEFVPLLQRLDECLAYSLNNARFRDSAMTVAKFRALQARGLGLVKEFMRKVLDETTRAARATLDSAGPDPAVKAADMGTTEISALFVRYRAVAPPLKTLLTEIDCRRKQRGHYAVTLEECRRYYFSKRQEVLGPIVAAYLTSLVEEATEARPDAADSSGRPRMEFVADSPGGGPLTFARAASAYMLKICVLEEQLYHAFFPQSSADEGALLAFLEEFCRIMYTLMRPLCLALFEIESIVGLIEVFKLEILQEEVPRRGTAGKAVKATVLRIVQDLQERLIYRVEIFIRDEIKGFIPTDEDLNYPAKLSKSYAPVSDASSPHHGAPTQTGDVPPAGKPLSGAAEGKTSSGSANDDGSAADKRSDPAGAPSATAGTTVSAGVNSERHSSNTPANVGKPRLYPSWYRVLEDTLSCLSRMYRCVEKPIFAGLAQTLVAECTYSLLSASEKVHTRAGPIDSKLFLVKHLLILREQLFPFDVDLCYTERTLDFSHLPTLFRRILQGEIHLRWLRSVETLRDLLLTHGPQVLETPHDTKAVMESHLKQACEEFIMHITNVVASPLMDFTTKLAAIQSSHAPGADFSSESFAHPDKLNAVIEEALSKVKEHLPSVAGAIGLYLEDTPAVSALWKPIRTNTIGAFSEVRMMVVQTYSVDQRMLVKLPPPNELEALLDGLGIPCPQPSTGF